MDNTALFQAGQNCWRTGIADYAAMLVDSSNFYGALYESICKAKRSIFILGWDIDSRIELMRGKEADRHHGPVTLFDVICKKALENPDLQIYLNRWKYSMFFATQREPFWVRKWKLCKLPNIHVCHDGIIPMTACHHQKIIVIDDEIAFWGGMDVALGRWDWRQHHVRSSYRADPCGLPNPEKKTVYGPYHDVQAVLAGPVVTAFSRLVRDRWAKACCGPVIPIVPYAGPDLPMSWPDSAKPQFKNIPVALARTVPPMLGDPAVEEVFHMFLDEIAQAEHFIYIENQYLACEKIAEALNRRLHEIPALRILAVSCEGQQGTVERKAMGGGLVECYRIITKGGVGGRFALYYPACKENGVEKPIHIHSKIMVIDDKFLHIGSSNIANRSMGTDTEFDVTIIGHEPASRKMIEAVRNDLIREHCGREIADIQQIIEDGLPVVTFREDINTGHQHFRDIDLKQYQSERLIAFCRFIGDPRKPIIPMALTSPLVNIMQRQTRHREKNGRQRQA